MSSSPPATLSGRGAVVTGVGRRAGIGFAISRRLVSLGASVFASQCVEHDRRQPWGADPDAPDALLAELEDAAVAANQRFGHLDVDLAEPDAPDRLIARALGAIGRLDILICNHAQSGSDGPLSQLTAGMLDSHYAVNTRSSILLAKAFSSEFEPAVGATRPAGRVVFLTSGQDLGPMPGEVAYAAAKGALSSITLTLADELAALGITVNTVNPGPVDTGYADEAAREAVRARMPHGRWGEPDDAARLIVWLCTDDARWITGQVVNSEGGFRRWGGS